MKTNVLTKLQTVVLMLRATITGDLITANENQDLLKMDGLAKVKQGPVSEFNVNLQNTNKCKYLLFFSGIIEQNHVQLCIF